MPVSELLARTSAPELGWWKAYDAIQPCGDDRAALRSAQIACLLYNINRKKGAREAKPSDFMPYLQVQQPEQTVEQQVGIWARIAHAMARKKQKKSL